MGEEDGKRLINGVRVELEDFLGAGRIYISRVVWFSDVLRYEESGGQPYESAYRNAEMLAIAIDAEFVVKHKVVRESLSGEYSTKDKETSDAKTTAKD